VWPMFLEKGKWSTISNSIPSLLNSPLILINLLRKVVSLDINLW
jgi:hypothetical protein